MNLNIIEIKTEIKRLALQEADARVCFQYS